MARRRKQKKKHSLSSALLLLLSLSLFAYAGYLGWDYYSDILNQNRNAEVALVEAIEVIDSKIDFRKEKPADGTRIGKVRLEGYTDFMPILEAADENDINVAMDYGVGRVGTSALPGENKQVVLSAHRETFFSQIGNIKEGDIITVVMPYGTFKYKFRDHKIVRPHESDKVYSFDELETEELVLITCYPFGFWTSPDFRYIVYADLIESTLNDKE